MSNEAFLRYIGIYYSGAEVPTASLKGLRVYRVDGNASPFEVLPPHSPRKYWTRRGIAEWLVELLAEDVPTLVGIDHGFSFPVRYFEVHGLKPDWATFLDDFQKHWPTDDDNTYVDFVRDGVAGKGAARTGGARWRRLTEERAGGAKSVFHFDVPGAVAKSTHAGIPWLRLSAVSSASAFISGPSMAGIFPPGDLLSPKCIPLCGAEDLPVRAGLATSMMLTAPPRGFHELTRAETSANFSSPPLRNQSAQ
jgi:hypothetical protein